MLTKKGLLKSSWNKDSKTCDFEYMDWDLFYFLGCEGMDFSKNGEWGYIISNWTSFFGSATYGAPSGSTIRIYHNELPLKTIDMMRGIRVPRAEAISCSSDGKVVWILFIDRDNLKADIYENPHITTPGAESDFKKILSFVLPDPLGRPTVPDIYSPTIIQVNSFEEHPIDLAVSSDGSFGYFLNSKKIYLYEKNDTCLHLYETPLSNPENDNLWMEEGHVASSISCSDDGEVVWIKTKSDNGHSMLRLTKKEITDRAKELQVDSLMTNEFQSAD